MSQLSDLQQDVQFLWRDMQDEWADARGEWRDAVAERFEREYWDDLENEMPPLLSAMSELDEAFQHAVLQLQR
jgi:hypothetical protein